MGELVPPGFRFYPTEEELISFYLMNKLEGRRQELHRVIPVVKLYNLDPWHLPKLSGEACRSDTEQWFFFTARQEREAMGGRPSRITASGYWKATGSPNYVYSSDNRVIGVKKTMVFYKGKAPTGKKTKWKMNEYRAIQNPSYSSPSTNAIPKLMHEFSLCRVYVISGSFSTFDRRPLDGIKGEIQAHGDGTATSSRQNVTLRITTSSETSYHGDLQRSSSEGNNTNWKIISDPQWDYPHTTMQCNFD